MNTYRFTPECRHDTEALLQVLRSSYPGEFISAEVFEYDDPLVIPEVDLHVRTLTLEQVRAAMRQVEDGHVMVQTVQPKEKFTGIRDFSLR